MVSAVLIASSGYSGSTLLEMLLGSAPGIRNVGELYKLPLYFGSGTALCTCGALVCDCSFWRAVERELRVVTGKPELSLAEHQLYSNRSGGPHDSWSKVGRVPPPGLPDLALLFGNRGLLRCLSKVSKRARNLDRAGVNTWQLYEAIAHVSGCSTLVDSSKEISVVKNVFLHGRDQVRVIFLVRDGRAVANSLMKHDGVDAARAARIWRRKNWRLRLGLRTIPARLIHRLHYEKLCLDTEAELERLGNFLGRDLSRAATTFDKRSYCTVGGNPMRFRRDESEIRLDEKWRTSLNPEDLETIEGIVGPLNRKFGYPAEIQSTL